jgi:hypothetical protein
MKLVRSSMIVGLFWCAGVLLSSCEQSGQLGSETNWLAPCQPGAHCSKGACVCGICTSVCGGDEACAGTPAARCIESGTEPHSTLCAADRSVAGVCAATCDTSRDCPAGARCVASVCVPRGDASVGTGGTGGDGSAGGVNGTSGAGGGSSGGASAGGGSGTGTGGNSAVDAGSGGQGDPDSSVDGAPDGLVGAGWPPSPATTAACAPNCDFAQCGAGCSQGAPCETGCCQGNTIAVETVSNLSNAPLSGTALAVDSSGSIHYAELAVEPFYLQKGASGWSTETNPDVATFGRDAGYDQASRVFVTATKRGSTDVVYLAYTLSSFTVPTLPSRGRFGTKTGGTWVFETLHHRRWRSRPILPVGRSCSRKAPYSKAAAAAVGARRFSRHRCPDRFGTSRSIRPGRCSSRAATAPPSARRS